MNYVVITLSPWFKLICCYGNVILSFLCGLFFYVWFYVSVCVALRHFLIFDFFFYIFLFFIHFWRQEDVVSKRNDLNFLNQCLFRIKYRCSIKVLKSQKLFEKFIFHCESVIFFILTWVTILWMESMIIYVCYLFKGDILFSLSISFSWIKFSS